MFDPGEARPGFDGQRDGAEQTSCLQPHPGWVGDESVKDRETGREIINCQSVSQAGRQTTELRCLLRAERTEGSQTFINNHLHHPPHILLVG